MKAKPVKAIGTERVQMRERASDDSREIRGPCKPHGKITLQERFEHSHISCNRSKPSSVTARRLTQFTQGMATKCHQCLRAGTKGGAARYQARRRDPTVVVEQAAIDSEAVQGGGLTYCLMRSRIASWSCRARALRIRRT